MTNHNGSELLKPVDFGIAKVVSHENAPTQNLTQTGEIFGSPMHMSPEQCQGMRLDARSDIYSFGCVMYEALHDAQELDRRSYEYFQRGEYEKAIPLLEFGVKTYREGGSGLGRGGEDNHLADNYSHIGKCYLHLKNWTKAAENYKEALKIYNKVASTGAPMMGEAVSDYATVLKNMGREVDAAAMMKDFQASRRVNEIP